MYKRILVPLDGSALAEIVLPHVRALALCTHADIILLRVPGIPAYAFAPGDLALLEASREAIEDEVQTYLEGIKRDLSTAGLRFVTVMEEGAVADVIIAVAEKYHADLIAMSTHGRGGLARLVMGSVADQVVRHAPLPVLLVRPTPQKATVEVPVGQARQKPTPA
jgi:nucleotide-binding universal stress UspA family protein